MLGVLTWLTLGRGKGLDAPAYCYAAAAGAGVWMIGVCLAARPGARAALHRFQDAIARPSDRVRTVTAVIISLAAGAYLLGSALLIDHDFSPLMHDEFSYVLGARQLLAGRLWFPAHPLGDFFDTFYVLVTPVYCSMYFVGTAMALALPMSLGLPGWIASLLACMIAAGLVYRIVSELLDGFYGVLCAALLIGTSKIRWASVVFMSQPFSLLAGLLLTWQWLRWRRAEKRTAWRWELAMGATAGWAIVIRPLDALAFIVPVLIALAAESRRFGFWRRAGMLSRGAIGAAPLLAVQVIFNLGVTGQALRTPFDLYADRDYPGTRLGFRQVDANAKPASIIPQKQMFFRLLRDSWQEDHQISRLPTMIFERLPMVPRCALPHPLLLVLIPAAFMAMTWRRALFCAPAAVFFALYLLYIFFLPHYMVAIAPHCVFLAAMGLYAVRAAGGRWGAWLWGLLLTEAVAMSICATPLIDARVEDWPVVPYMENAARAVDQLKSGPPAVVLFPCTAQRVEQDPVYNSENAWPDDARVIRAHDLGARNIEIFRYYPHRMFYRYHQRSWFCRDYPRRTFFGFNTRTGRCEFLGTGLQCALRSAIGWGP